MKAIHLTIRSSKLYVIWTK